MMRAEDVAQSVISGCKTNRRGFSLVPSHRAKSMDDADNEKIEEPSVDDLRKLLEKIEK